MVTPAAAVLTSQAVEGRDDTIPTAPSDYPAAQDRAGSDRTRDARVRDARTARLRRRRGMLAVLAVTGLTIAAVTAPGIGGGAAQAGHRHESKHESKHASKHGAAKKSARADHGRRRHGDSKEAARHGGRHHAHDVPLPRQRPSERHETESEAVPALPPDLAATRQAIELLHQDKYGAAAAAARSIIDPVAQKLVEWVSLRRAASDAGLPRYEAFLRAGAGWPSGLVRRRMEGKLWQDQWDAATVRRLAPEPVSAPGRLALAAAELHDGNRAAAERLVRTVWRASDLSPDAETAVLAAFPGMVTREDHAARMDRLIGSRAWEAAMRAARRAGDDQPAVVKACSGAEAKPKKAAALLSDVPGAMHTDLGWTLCRLHWLLRNDVPGANLAGAPTPKPDIAAAVKLVLSASAEDLARQDTDEWWRARRILARKLLDTGDPRTAYRVASAAAPPANPYYRADVHFMSGWIALRFLDDPATASRHFERIDEDAVDPVVKARGAYWRGRAAEAAGRAEEMRAQYERAASLPTAYYGQLARARMGLSDIAVLRPLPEEAPAGAAELVHAAEILYAIGEKGVLRSFVSEVAEENGDPPTLAALGQLTAERDDAPAMLLLGKTALAHGIALDHYAFPATGVPAYDGAGGHKLDRCIVYAIVRTESAFEQSDRSAAKAVGLMQVTPSAGRDTARRFGLTYDWDRMVSDPAYNTRMGAAEVAALLADYRGSFILTFAGYNAGRGRVQQWVALHGDPRDPQVDAVDWVERIPLAETRNYVQRVMENLQVYRARFGGSTATVEPNLHRAATLD